MPLRPLLTLSQATVRPEASGKPFCCAIAWKLTLPGGSEISPFLPETPVTAMALVRLKGC